MTYRERREAKAARLRGWANKRREDAARTLESQPELRHDWAFITQPGHIPERARMNARDERAYASLGKAADMTGRAAGITSQLDHAIYSDDPDAAEALTERIATLEAKRDRIKRYNASARKGAPDSSILMDDEREDLKWCAHAGQVNASLAFPGYTLSNLGADIRRNKQRLEALKTPREPRSTTARYAGKCPACTLPWRAGAPITEIESGIWAHEVCAAILRTGHALEEARAVLRGYGPLSTCSNCRECTWENEEDER